MAQSGAPLSLPQVDGHDSQLGGSLLWSCHGEGQISQLLKRHDTRPVGKLAFKQRLVYKPVQTVQSLFIPKMPANEIQYVFQPRAWTSLISDPNPVTFLYNSKDDHNSATFAFTGSSIDDAHPVAAFAVKEAPYAGDAAYYNQVSLWNCRFQSLLVLKGVSQLTGYRTCFSHALGKKAPPSEAWLCPRLPINDNKRLLDETSQEPGACESK